jgi:hypothetical protein
LNFLDYTSEVEEDGAFPLFSESAVRN